MLQTLKGEGVTFAREYIDRTFPADNAPTRKPGTAMLTEYMTDDYDLKHSYVIGDRATDVQLAVNMGCRAILLHKPEVAATMLNTVQQHVLALATDDWADIAEFLRRTERRAEVKRATAETDIHVIVDLDGGGDTLVNTGLHFSTTCSASCHTMPAYRSTVCARATSRWTSTTPWKMWP